MDVNFQLQKFLLSIIVLQKTTRKLDQYKNEHKVRGVKASKGNQGSHDGRGQDPGESMIKESPKYADFTTQMMEAKNMIYLKN